MHERLFFLSILLCHIAAAEGAGQRSMGDNEKALKHFNGATEESVVIFPRENLESDKKIARKGILLKRPQAKATVLICHGFSCDKYDISLLQMIFKDYNTMTFDFRAHGENARGQCCTFGRDESHDVVAAAQYLRNHDELKQLPLIVYGFSMGAVASIIAQAREPHLFDAMILDCPFDSSDKLIERAIGQLKLNLFGYEMSFPGASILKNYAYNAYVQSLIKAVFKTFTKFQVEDINTLICPVYPEEAIKYVDIPCFFIACVNDDKAPVEAVLSVYDGAKGFKRCWIDHEGRRHFDTLFRRMPDYCYKAPRFIEKVISGAYLDKQRSKITRDRPLCVLTETKKKRS